MNSPLKTLLISCRSCRSSTAGLPVDMYEDNWLEMYNFCINNTADLKEPTCLCRKCSESLKAAYDFKKMCLQSEKLWNLAYEKYSSSLSDVFNYTENEHKYIDCGNSINISEMDENNHQFNVTNSKEKLELSTEHYKDTSNYLEVDSDDDFASINDNEETLLEKVKHTLKLQVEFHGECGLCGKDFSNQIWLEKHVRTCGQPKKRRVQHMRKKTAGTSVEKNSTESCGICSYTVVGWLRMKRHLLGHYHSGELTCACGHQAADFADLLYHRHSHVNQRTTEDRRKRCLCVMCPRKFVSPLYLAHHFRRRHAAGALAGACHHCHMHFDNIDALKKHTYLHKNELLRCDYCGRGYPNKSTLTPHILKHMGHRPYKCQYCDARFTRKPDLDYHIKALHLSKGNAKCDHCGRRYRSEHSLRRHLKSLIKERRHVCQQCNKKFISQLHLDRHQVTHSDARPYCCHICGKAYKLQRHLNVHLQETHSDKVYPCTICSSKYKSTIALRRHMQQMHQKKKLHKCNECMMCFSTERRLYSHVATMHTVR